MVEEVKVIRDWNGGGINLRLRRKLEKKNTSTVPILMPASGICSIHHHLQERKKIKTGGVSWIRTRDLLMRIAAKDHWFVPLELHL